jgi:nucleoside-diphosphate-sugar epimerase
MRALVTGAAGFIGSHLVERLVSDGVEVRGVDILSDYYDREQKEGNLDVLAGLPGVEVRREDLLTCRLDALLDGVDVVFHQAGQPGVRASWKDGFPSYVDANVLVTQRLLEAIRDRPPLSRFVFASSSSVYGEAEVYPATEDTVPRPRSPYGVTKLAAEHLCGVYGANFGVPTVSLRYFTVYGPRQRPDMAMHRLVEAALDGAMFPMFGDGRQIRDFTFVGDIVEANIRAAQVPLEPATVINVAGGSSVELLQVISIVGELCGSPVRLDVMDPQAGDVRRTGGSTERARQLLGWSPEVPLREGLRRQVAWHRARRGIQEVA